jgi:hypothetical protein
MRNALNLFNALIDSTKSVEIIYSYINGMTSIIDCSDLLRWQWVQSVSALDRFIHDIVRIGIIEIFKETRAETKKYKTFLIDLDTVSMMMAS